MKIKTSTIIWLIVALIWCIFMGITAVSMGFGSEFPSLNKVAQPFVCPGGQMELTSQNYQVSPVESGSVLNWYCADGKAAAPTELNPFIINLYAGLIYGPLLFAAILIIWYFYSRWDPSKESAETKKRVAWIQAIAVIIFFVCVTFFMLGPMIGSMIPSPTSAPDATATALANAYQSLTLGQPEAFTSTDRPLANWNGIPIMTQATAGQQVKDGVYTFRVPIDSETVFTFYGSTLKPLGWTIEDTQWMGMEFIKDRSTLLVTTAPATDEESFIVTLSLYP